MEYTLEDNSKEQQFEFLLDDGEKAFIAYRIKDGIVYLIHTSVPEHQEGKGIAAELAVQLFTRLRKENIHGKLYCPYLKTFVERNPEWEDLFI
jgi:predicted GNAT family acetyltransferase